MKRLLFLMCSVCVGSLYAVDGTYWGKNDNGTNTWSSLNGWFNQTAAGNGGVAWFNSSQLHCLNQDVPGLELTGMQFGGRWMHVIGNPITFTGDYSWITRSAYDVGAHTPGFDIAFRGTGSNTLKIADNGWLYFALPFEDFGLVKSSHMDLRAWNTSGDCFTTGNFQLTGGCVTICPKNGAGETASVTIASRDGTQFTYGPSMGRLRVDKGSGAGTTLTIGTLSRFAGGGALALEAVSGLANLGGDEKVIVSGTAPSVVNGICDASIVGRAGNAEFWRLCFMTYDSAAGFKKATVASVPFATATADDIALIDANTTISGTKAVHALYVDGEPTITFEDGSVLQVGDGEHPAGIIFNATASARIQPSLQGKGGTIAFGGAQGTIYFNNIKDSPTLTINQKITGTGGLTLVGAHSGATRNYVHLVQDAEWTGNTAVSGLSLYVMKASCLPEEGRHLFRGRQQRQSLRMSASDRIAHLRREAAFPFRRLGIQFRQWRSRDAYGRRFPDIHFQRPC